jgi:hypothetical protein
VTGEQKADGAPIELPVLPIKFIQITEYTTFRAEVAITDGDIVFHFYANEEINKLPDPRKYWLELFPNALSSTAEVYFNATFPRLKAAYTEEQASWWMRAFGFGKLLDPHRFAYKFFDVLDAALDGEMPKAT